MESDSTHAWQIQRSIDLLALLIIQMILLYLYTIFIAFQLTGPLVLNVAIAGILLIVLTLFQQLHWLLARPALIFGTTTISRILILLLLIGTWVILIH